MIGARDLYLFCAVSHPSNIPVLGMLCEIVVGSVLLSLYSILSQEHIPFRAKMGLLKAAIIP